MFGSGAPASATLDMAITRADFLRLLTAAFGTVHALQHDVFTGCHDGCAWRIALRPATPTRLGLIELERWTACIELDAATARCREVWWRRFTAHFQKGGG